MIFYYNLEWVIIDLTGPGFGTVSARSHFCLWMSLQFFPTRPREPPAADHSRYGSGPEGPKPCGGCLDDNHYVTEFPTENTIQYNIIQTISSHFSDIFRHKQFFMQYWQSYGKNGAPAHTPFSSLCRC